MRSAADAARRAQQRRQQTVGSAQYSYPAYAQPPRQRDARGRYTSQKKSAENPKEKKKRWLLWGGALCTGLAAGFGAATISTLAEFIESLTHGYFFADELTAPVLMAILAAVNIWSARKCFFAKDRDKRYELYRTIIGGREVCPVAEIARSSGRKPKKVLRELQEMVRDGYFPLGFVDEETGCYYASNDAYRAANPERARRQDEELMKNPVPAPTPAAEPAEKTDADDLSALRREIARVENADIREKAERLCRHAEDIFAWVKLHPECTDDVRRFCSYYLPTAAKLLSTYNEVAPHADESSVAAGIEGEVSRVLDTMITAFRELMDHLLQNTAVDMKAEISALETVLAQEGLTEQEMLKIPDA